jgi:hypothetical protein
MYKPCVASIVPPGARVHLSAISIQPLVIVKILCRKLHTGMVAEGIT